MARKAIFIMDGEQQPAARFQRAERRQIEWRPLSLNQMIPEDHTARLVWAYVEQLDLSELYASIRAVEGKPGRDPIDPRILLALWLFATIEGVGSARRLDKLSREHMAYLWLCGGVTVNYHALADFRVKHAGLLDKLLTQSVATLLHQGLIELNRVAQDGMRVRAAASNSSFRRKPTLERCLKDAQQHLADLQMEAEENPGAESTRVTAARERAARERQERIEAALAERDQVAAKMERRQKGSGDEARCSTTDPEARIMKMGDNGFRPAYNVQFATTADSLVIIGVDVTNQGTDGGLMGPMLDQIHARYDVLPDAYLADGGFVSLDDITTLDAAGVTPYLPIPDEKRKRAKGEDPYAARKGDSGGVIAWRERMGTEEAAKIYKARSATAEFPNAGCRNRGLHQFNVRGSLKAKAVALWHALAHNLQRTWDLHRQASLAGAQT